MRHDKKPIEIAWWIIAALWFAGWHFWQTRSVWLDPFYRVPGPVGDNMVMLWNLGWIKHAFNHGSAGYWFTNAYYPDGFLFLFSTHTWLDGVLGWLVSGLLPDGFQGSILWANITMLTATTLSGLLVIAGLKTWGIRTWPLLILISSAVTFSWFRMFALTGHYHFYGTQWMLAALVFASWGRKSFSLNEDQRGYIYYIFAGVMTGLAFLNDQTMAVFSAVLTVLIIVATGSGRIRERFFKQAIISGCFSGSALAVASAHLFPIFQAINKGKLTYNLGTTGSRVVDASSLILPPDYHLFGSLLVSYRNLHGLQWAEGTYLGLVPMALITLGTVGSLQFLLQGGRRTRAPRNAGNNTFEYKTSLGDDISVFDFPRSEVFTASVPGEPARLSETYECQSQKLPVSYLRVCFIATIAAWSFVILALGDTLTIGHDSFSALPGRLLESVPVLNNIRLPQRWIWPAQLCIGLGGGSALSFYSRRWPPIRLGWGLFLLAFVPPMEGAMSLPPVDFRNDSFVRPANLVKAVSRNYADGGVLVMPVEAAYAHGNVLQFLWGYDIPLTVVYTARMPFSIQSLPWSGKQWTPETGTWLQSKKVTTIVFPFHDSNLTEYQPWLRKAMVSVPYLKVFNCTGKRVQISPD